MEDGNQEPISCEGCKSWRTGVGRCDVDLGKDAKKAKVRLCSFCHGERMRYFRRTWWGEPLPLSALPPPPSPPASPRPPAPGQPAQLAAEAPDGGAESIADTHSQASSRGSHHGGMPPAAATSALDQQMMERFFETVNGRLSIIEAMLVSLMQARGLDMPQPQPPAPLHGNPPAVRRGCAKWNGRRQSKGKGDGKGKKPRSPGSNGSRPRGSRALRLNNPMQHDATRR